MKGLLILACLLMFVTMNIALAQDLGGHIPRIYGRLHAYNRGRQHAAYKHHQNGHRDWKHMVEH
uniref:Uncharacterized protein n=1 Tax=Anopheles minimus TaxID=112268 RepID=A0A182WN91_9DIPT